MLSDLIIGLTLLVSCAQLNTPVLPGLRIIVVIVDDRSVSSRFRLKEQCVPLLYLINPRQRIIIFFLLPV